LYFTFSNLVPEPPEAGVGLAWLSLSQAASGDAATYSGRLYNEARALYDSAMINWEAENRRFIFFRDYDRVAAFAELSTKKSEQALENSKSNASSLEIKIRQKIDSLNNLVTQINRVFKAYPLTGEIWNGISKGRMLLKESEIAYGKGQYLQANKKITDSEYLLTASFEKASLDLKEYFNNYPLWQIWVNKTIKESRQNQSCSIIIDKYSRKCIVYLSGVRKYEYKVELSTNWVGDKLEKGDKATPEGMYRITKKFKSNKTKYYKALLIDYPNETDKAEFKKAIARGTLSRNAKIGSLIEIHGNGGKGVDWTEGCIALVDSEMDVVFKVVKEGTPVTIVGSMVDLKQVLD
jgi:hypothetical protein